MKENRYQQELTLENLQEMEIEIESYRLKVMGTEEEVFRLEVETEQAKEMDEDDLSQLFQIDISQNKESAKLSIRQHPEIKKARFLVELPRQLALKISNKSAHLQVNNFAGKQIIKSQHGPILLQQNSGILSLKNQNGKSNIEQYQGEIKLTSLNGTNRLKGCQANCWLETANGSIRLASCSGKLKIHSKNGLVQVAKSNFSQADISNLNGQISYQFMPLPAGDFKFQNQNGRILLVIPENLEYGLQARSKQGRINIAIPGEYAQSSEDGYKKIEMQKASGKVKIFAENIMGGILLSNTPLKSDKKKSRKGFKFNINFGKHDIDTDKLQKDLDATFNSVKDSFGKLDMLNLANLKETVLNSIDQSNLKETVLNSINQNMPSGEQPENLSDKAEEEISTAKADEDSEAYQKILELLQAGKIAVEDADKLIDALEGK